MIGREARDLSPCNPREEITPPSFPKADRDPAGSRAGFASPRCCRFPNLHGLSPSSLCVSLYHLPLLLPQEELFGVEQAGEEVFQAGAAIFGLGEELESGFLLRVTGRSAKGSQV